MLDYAKAFFLGIHVFCLVHIILPSCARGSFIENVKREERARFIQRKLNKLYPDPITPLDHKDAYTLLVAVLLSARCTDKKVNEVTPSLFKLADNPKSMAVLSLEKVRVIIKPCGLSPSKSKAIVGLSKILIEKYDGKVPKTFEELEELPGVGHKTASVVMSQAFGLPSLPVDTHVERLARKWGLSTSRNVKKVEDDLKSLFPKKDWGKTALQMIYFGREICTTRLCDGTQCEICSVVNA